MAGSTPTVINGYKVKKVLHESDTKSTYIVKSKEDGKTYILKMLNAANAHRHEVRKFFNHVRVGTSIRHRNIIHVANCFSIAGQDQTYCYVEEYATYGSLKRFILKNIQSNGHTSEVDAWSLILQMVRAYRFLHANELLHCSIKPSNVMIFKNGTVKIRNFGFATKARPDNQIVKRRCMSYYLM